MLPTCSLHRLPAGGPAASESLLLRQVFRGGQPPPPRPAPPPAPPPSSAVNRPPRSSAASPALTSPAGPDPPRLHNPPGPWRPAAVPAPRVPTYTSRWQPDAPLAASESTLQGCSAPSGAPASLRAGGTLCKEAPSLRGPLTAPPHSLGRHSGPFPCRASPLLLQGLCPGGRLEYMNIYQKHLCCAEH